MAITSTVTAWSKQSKLTRSFVYTCVCVVSVMQMQKLLSSVMSYAVVIC